MSTTVLTTLSDLAADSRKTLRPQSYRCLRFSYTGLCLAVATATILLSTSVGAVEQKPREESRQDSRQLSDISVEVVSALSHWWYALRRAWSDQVRLDDAVDSPPATVAITAAHRAVPHLQGERDAVAQQLLRLLDLNSATGKYYVAPDAWRTTLQPGTVLMQTPQPGLMVEAGETVAYWTFLPATADHHIVATPDVRGVPLREAAARLVQAGLRTMRHDPGRQPDGNIRVIDQYPRARQSVYQGTSVFIQVASDEKN